VVGTIAQPLTGMRVCFTMSAQLSDLLRFSPFDDAQSVLPSPAVAV